MNTPGQRWDPRAVTIAAAVFALVYVGLDLNKLAALRYGADTGTFVQFLVGEAHGAGSWNGAELRPHLQVHDSWILLALVPLMAVFPYTQTLLIVQVLAVAAAGPLVALFARACGAAARGANAVGIATLLSPSMQGLAYGNFLENVFVPVIAAGGAIAVRTRRLLPALACAQLLLGIKEDQALFLLWLGVACALWWDRRLGLGIAALALLNGLGFVALERLAHAQPSLPAYGLHVDDPLAKLAFFAALLAPFAFAPLWLGARLLLALPLVAELTLNGPWAYPIARIGTHWAAPLAIATALGAAVVVAARPRWATAVLVCAVLCALTINDTVLKLGRWPYVVDRTAYAAALRLRDSGAAAEIPRHAEGVYAVAAPNRRITLAPYVRGEAGYCPAYDTNARAFLASIGLGAWPRGVRLCAGVPLPG
ncbi:MAG TPA: DUF2079 domain-containing protein [Solirubrobacteraceae bacterium]|nr:DUF2079 domain-containing protein [Solirubrobacteraceae bacterium]